MGQKFNPIGIRLGITKDWNSKWYAEQEAVRRSTCIADFRVREFLQQEARRRLGEPQDPDRASRQEGATSRSTPPVRAS